MCGRSDAFCTPWCTDKHPSKPSIRSRWHALWMETFTHTTQKIQAIVDPTHQIKFGDVANGPLLEVMQSCLQRNPRDRPAIEQLLDHRFLHPERDAPAPGNTLIGMTREQLLALVQAAAHGNSPGRLVQAVLARGTTDEQARA